VRFGVCCSEHSLCQIILHCLFVVHFWTGRHPTTVRFGVCCHSLCQIILQCLFGVQFGMERHPFTVRCGVCCSEHSLCQVILHSLFGVHLWSGETLYYGAMWGVLL